MSVRLGRLCGRRRRRRRHVRAMSVPAAPHRLDRSGGHLLGRGGRPLARHRRALRRDGRRSWPRGAADWPAAALPAWRRRGVRLRVARHRPSRAARDRDRRRRSPDRAADTASSPHSVRRGARTAPDRLDRHHLRAPRIDGDAQHAAVIVHRALDDRTRPLRIGCPIGSRPIACTMSATSSAAIGPIGADRARRILRERRRGAEQDKPASANPTRLMTHPPRTRDTVARPERSAMNQAELGRGWGGARQSCAHRGEEPRRHRPAVVWNDVTSRTRILSAHR